MDESIWRKPLDSLYEDLAAPKPAPAGITAAAVSGRLGLGLLIKVLEIAGRRKSFAGDRDKLAGWIEAARREADKLAEAADEDIFADGSRRRSEIPMKAARAAESGLAICAEARGVATGAIAADLEVADRLLAAARAAILLCADANAQTRP